MVETRSRLKKIDATVEKKSSSSKGKKEAIVDEDNKPPRTPELSTQRSDAWNPAKTLQARRFICR